MPIFDEDGEVGDTMLHAITDPIDHFDVFQRLPQAEPAFVTEVLQSCHRRLADFAGRHVDDPEHRDRVCGIEYCEEVGEDVLHFFARVEFQPAEDAVGDAGPETRFFKEPRLRIRSVQDYLVCKRNSLCLE